MESGCAPQFLERQAFDSGTPVRPASPRSPPRSTKVQGFATEAHAEIIFDAFVNAVERLEGLLDKETAMLIERQPIALDDFNHKKRHGLLELSRAMDAVRGVDRDCPGRDPKAALARLRVKLQKNLAILQMHLDAVGAIAQSFLVPFKSMTQMAPIRPNLVTTAGLDESADCQLHLDNRRYFGIGICEFHVEIPEYRKRSAYEKGGRS